MGRLCELPGRNFVAQQSGWDGATSAHFSLLARPAAPMVPDGKQIAFAASMPGKRFHVYIVSADVGFPKK